MGNALSAAPLLTDLVDFDASVKLAQRFSRWGSALDSWLCDRHGICNSQTCRYCGRLCMPRFVTRPVMLRCKTLPKDVSWSPVMLWSCLEERLKEFRCAVAGRFQRGPGMQRWWAIGETMLREVWAAMRDVEHPIDQCLIILVALRLEQVATLPGVVLDLSIHDVLKLKLAAEASVRRHVRGLTCTWAKHAATANGAAEACRYIMPVKLPSDGVIDRTSEQRVYGPMECANARAAIWGHQCTARTATDGHLRGLVSSSKDAAREDKSVLGRISMPELRHAIKAIRTKTAPGCDNIAPYDLRSMPVEAAEELLELLNQCGDQLCVPLLVFCNLMCAIPKDIGGERVIALMAMAMRVLAKCRRWRCTEWDQTRPSWWDSAIAGSSALRAAVWRSFLDETAGLMQACVATAYIEIEKFYDSLDLVKLLGKLIDLEFPPLQLCLHVQMHVAGRVILNDKCCSEVVHITRSILAGCTSSNSMARGYMYDLYGKHNARLRAAPHGVQFCRRSCGSA